MESLSRLVTKVLFITQQVDPQHPSLAATVPKIRALAERVDEVVVLADADNDPRRIAVDLLAQAEHDEAAQSILITDSAAFADAVAAAVTAELPSLPRAVIAGASWDANGAVIVVRDWAEAVALVDRLAPEHLELMVRDPEAVFARVRHAGAAFLGGFCPEAIGEP